MNNLDQSEAPITITSIQICPNQNSGFLLIQISFKAQIWVLRYSQELMKMVKSKGGVLTHGELQLVVDTVNETLNKDFVR